LTGAIITPTVPGMLVESYYRGYRIEVQAELVDGAPRRSARWDSTQ